MARIETWLDCDLKKIIRVHEIKGNVFTQDHLGNLIGVRVYDDGEPVTLAGSVNGYCILADGSTVPVDGDRDTSGNRAWIILPQSAYAVPGTIRITIKLTETDGDDVDHIVTLASLVGTVTRSKTDNMVTPSSQVITDWSQQISAEMQEVSDAAAAAAGNFAAAYSTTKTYSVGEYVTYNGALYRCTTAVTTAGSWSSNSGKFAAVKMGNDVADLKSALDFDVRNIKEMLGEKTKNLMDARFITRDGFIECRFYQDIPAGTYTLTINITTDSTTNHKIAVLSTETYSSSATLETKNISVTDTDTTWTFTISEPAKSIYVFSAISVSGSAGHTIKINKIQLETGSEATEYKLPYIANDTIARAGMVLPSNSGDWTTDGANITTELSKSGYCKLSAGVYRIGTIGFPNGSTKPVMIEGSGKRTVILVNNDNTYNYGIRISNNCIIKDLTIKLDNDQYTPGDVYTAENIKHGILIKATTDTDKTHAVVENVSIENFSGAGICINGNGQGTSDGSHVLNCWVDNCGAGLWMKTYSEFNRIECNNFDGCYYGVICDGGNNTIANCNLSNNKYGFYMNNSDGSLRNNSHSQIIGCIFNHEDYDSITLGKGWAIWINGASSGFQFVGGQIFYGGIYIKNSVGICFNSFNVGKMIENGTDVGIIIQLDHDDSLTRLVMFANSIFLKNPRFIMPEQDDKLVVYLRDCYLRSGVPITLS